jgi:hypothetical protein
VDVMRVNDTSSITQVVNILHRIIKYSQKQGFYKLFYLFLIILDLQKKNL